MNRTLKAKRTQGGIVLIEAMCAILIFSMGVLALVGLQAVSVKQVADAKYRADASFLASEIVGEMWVNRTNLSQYEYDGNGTPPASLTAWVSNVQSTLPLATNTNAPTIDVSGSTVTITLRWRPPGASEAHRYTTIAHINGA